MTTETLVQVLTKLGARKDGATFLMPAEADVTLFIALEGETLSITKVVRVDSEKEHLVATTTRGETFAFIATSVLAVKIDRGDGVRRDRSAGFSK